MRFSLLRDALFLSLRLVMSEGYPGDSPPPEKRIDRSPCEIQFRSFILRRPELIFILRLHRTGNRYVLITALLVQLEQESLDILLERFTSKITALSIEHVNL
jgi:hypothetical protein